MSNHKVYDYQFDHNILGSITFSIVGYAEWTDEQFDSVAHDTLDDLVKDTDEWTLNDCWETT